MNGRMKKEYKQKHESEETNKEEKRTTSTDHCTIQTQNTSLAAHIWHDVWNDPTQVLEFLTTEKQTIINTVILTYASY